MKKTALLAAAAALMAASPAAANGHVGLEYSSGESDVIIGADDSEGWQGEGAVGFGGAGWGAQIDGSFGNTEFDGGVDGDTYSLGGHLWWGGGGWRLGGVITTSNIDLSGIGLEIDETSYGIEGTYDVGASTVLFSSLTTGSGDLSGVVDYDTFNWDFGANFYASPNMRFGGFFGVGNVDLAGTEADSSSFGVHGEFQPWSAPVSLTIGYNSFQIDDFDVDTNAFQVGARWNFGGGTLRDRDNSTPFDTNSGAINRSANIW